MDIGQGRKPPGYYVQRSNGLFPAPWPQDCPELPAVSKHFELLGIFLAKCLQDGRRIDIPLSTPFFKMMCHAPFCDPSPLSGETPPSPVAMEKGGGEGVTEEEEGMEEEGGNKPEPMAPDQLAGSNRTHRSPSPSSPPSDAGGGVACEEDDAASSKETEVLLPSEEITKDGEGKQEGEVVLEELAVGGGDEGRGRAWFASVLGLKDLAEVDQYRGRFLLQLQALVAERDRVVEDASLSPAQRERLLAELTLPGEEENLPGPCLQDLW